MSRRHGALLLGTLATLGAVAFGSRPLTVVGAGLLLAWCLARVWMELVREDVRVDLAIVPERAVEGDHVHVAVEVERRSQAPIGWASFRASFGRLGSREVLLTGHGKRLSGELELGRLGRGVYPLAEGSIAFGDFLGLGSVSVDLGQACPTVVVFPRIVDLSAVASQLGIRGETGSRLLLRRPAGFDLHSVRDYEQGESLRRVHWPSSARRGTLMVKELQDTPGDGVVVLLDCDPLGAAGEVSDSSFDAAARAAGSVAAACAARARPVTLMTTGRKRQVVSCGGGRGEIDSVLTALAGAEPNATHGLAQALRTDEAAATSGSALVVVTGSPLAPAAEPLLRTAALRLVSIVWIDAPSFAGRPTRADPGLLRVAASGIPVVVVRQGEDLAQTFGTQERAVARA